LLQLHFLAPLSTSTKSISSGVEPPGEIRQAKVKPHYVGSISFFGRVQGKQAAGHGAGKPFTATFDVTDVAARLRNAGSGNRRS